MTVRYSSGIEPDHRNERQDHLAANFWAFIDADDDPNDQQLPDEDIYS